MTEKVLYQESVPTKSELTKVVRCLVCPHNCIVQQGKVGLCKTKVNINGELFSIDYGNLCSISVDPIEKKPLFHFFPGSEIFSLALAGCNLHCLNCQNWQISQLSLNSSFNNESSKNILMPADVVGKALQYGTNSIAFTYTEPTVFYEYTFDTAIIAHEKGLKTVLISNGYINQKPLTDLCPYLDAANIDLKCFDDSVYHKLTGGRLQPVLDTLKTIKAQGVWLEITNLLVPSWTDSPFMIQEMCKWLVDNGFSDTPLHFSRFFPTYKLSHLPPTQESVLINAKEIAEKTGIKFVYIGNLPQLRGESTYCPNCRRLLVERTGYLIKNNFIHRGMCSFCGEKIAGVWE